MSSFIDLIETFELHTMTSKIYGKKIDDLLERYPRLNSYQIFRMALPQKFPKTADDYVSMKFCIIGRFPVYGVYTKNNLQLIAVCVEGTLFAIDDCDLDPNLVPDLTFFRVNLGIRHSSLAVSQSLSYTKKTMCSAISTLSLGYTLGKKDEWTDAFVLLTGMTTQAVRFCTMHSHVQYGFLHIGDAEHIPHSICLSLQPKWKQVSKAIREGKLPYLYKFYDPFVRKICYAGVSKFSSANSVQLIDYGDRDKAEGTKFSKHDGSDGQIEGSKIKSKCENITGAALGATQNVCQFILSCAYDIFLKYRLNYQIRLNL
ncbi:hypothetical protein AgCh_012497 [Apium graveolens]